MEEGILSLKWNNHNSTFIHALSSLHKVESYSDVTLACDGKYFPVHKLVLSICSEYFEEIFSQTKCQHPVIVLKDIRHCDLEALLNYMYAGEANVSQSELASLIKAAECLRIKGLALPDETPPIRDKRRLGEISESSHSSKKRRNEESYSSVSNILSHYKNESDSENSRISIKSKRRSDDSSHKSIPDSRNDDSSSISFQDDEYRSIVVPEIKLEGDSVEVKQEVSEPKIEEHLDEESQHLESSNIGISYAVNIGTDSNNKEGDTHSPDSHIIPELIAHSVPGPSGVQGHEAMSSWENNANNISSGYASENFSSDEARSQQLGMLTFVGEEEMIWDGNTFSTKQNSFSCPYCYKTFPFKSTFERHIVIHTGERPFKCPYCPHNTNRKFSLTLHIRSVHKKPVTSDNVSVSF